MLLFELDLNVFAVYVFDQKGVYLRSFHSKN